MDINLRKSSISSYCQSNSYGFTVRHSQSEEEARFVHKHKHFHSYNAKLFKHVPKTNTIITRSKHHSITYSSSDSCFHYTHVFHSPALTLHPQANSLLFPPLYFHTDPTHPILLLQIHSPIPAPCLVLIHFTPITFYIHTCFSLSAGPPIKPIFLSFFLSLRGNGLKRKEYQHILSLPYNYKSTLYQKT